MICDVDVGRVEPFETVDCGEQGGYVVPFEWGQKLESETASSRSLGLFYYVYDFHVFSVCRHILMEPV